jgi:hypothetical protein
MLDFNCLIVRDEKKGNVKEEINPVSRKQNHLTDPGEREREKNKRPAQYTYVHF